MVALVEYFDQEDVNPSLCVNNKENFVKELKLTIQNFPCSDEDTIKYVDCVCNNLENEEMIINLIQQEFLYSSFQDNSCVYTYQYDKKIPKMKLYESINKSKLITKDQLIYIYAIVSKVDKWLHDYQALNKKIILLKKIACEIRNLYQEKHKKIYRSSSFNFMEFQNFVSGLLNQNQFLYEKEIFYHFSCIMYGYERYMSERLEYNILEKICPENVDVRFDIKTLFDDLRRYFNNRNIKLC